MQRRTPVVVTLLFAFGCGDDGPVDAERAHRRIFVSRAGTRFTYTFAEHESRTMAGDVDALVRQTLVAKAQQTARLERSGDRCYLITAAGEQVRVHDRVKVGRQRHAVKPRTSRASQCIFVPSSDSKRKRMVYLQSDNAREISPALQAQQLEESGTIAEIGVEQAQKARR
jgi:hypothetical protein